MELGAFGALPRPSPCAGRNRNARRLELAVPGRHNLQNALAAVAVGERIGLDFDRVAAALASFQAPSGVSSATVKSNGVVVVDDYGHHPTEIAAVVAAVRATLNRRLVIAFQPHRYFANGTPDGRVWPDPS